ncbi:unnamed protein product [Strongylus vulgaris]|uniref:Uncharacterized protein n=1 Tax=Strongylus vulgaris TaxID=40348 RepID=A0A3P7KMJ1_STRVU|nr:unnamed protein product [Strongylus vulgaris]
MKAGIGEEVLVVVSVTAVSGLVIMDTMVIADLVAIHPFNNKEDGDGANSDEALCSL